jgi:cation diffusion facilitator family transporter
VVTSDSMAELHLASDLVANKAKKTAAFSSVMAAVFLTAMKLVIGLLTGSLGIISEALHSGLDLVAAGVTFFAVNFSSRPADQEHPYGHGKIENISALFETFLLLLTCVWIVYEALNRLFLNAVHVEVSIWSFVIMSVSIIVDISRSRMLLKAAKKYNSQALEADGLHFSTDIWSSAVVIGGLFCVYLADKLHLAWLSQADAIAAIGVAGIVTYVSIQLGRRAIAQLIDEVSPALVLKIARAAAVPDALSVVDVRARHSGPETFVDLTIEVRQGMSIDHAHTVAEQVEAAVKSVVENSSVIVHVEPAAPLTGE